MRKGELLFPFPRSECAYFTAYDCLTSRATRSPRSLSIPFVMMGEMMSQIAAEHENVRNDVEKYHTSLLMPLTCADGGKVCAFEKARSAKKFPQGHCGNFALFIVFFVDVLGSAFQFFKVDFLHLLIRRLDHEQHHDGDREYCGDRKEHDRRNVVLQPL